MNFQFWLRNTLPGPGRSVATSAWSRPVVRPPCTTSRAEARASRKGLVVVQRVVVAGNLRVFPDVLGGQREAPARALTDLNDAVHSCRSFWHEDPLSEAERPSACSVAKPRLQPARPASASGYDQGRVTKAPRQHGRLLTWLYQGIEEPTGPHGKGQSTAPWWQVMCLTGVDYFSTLGYQPGIAFLAAGFLSPIATLILVLVTLFGALPAYARIARLSPHGQGSISVLEEKLPRWRGKAMVLCLLGFAATGFVITITLSAADATAHIIENPFAREWASHRVGLTLALIAALGAIFLKGLREAVWLAVTIVVIYLALNIVVVGNGLVYIVSHPETLSYWRSGVLTQQPNYLMAFVAALVVFPRLALGLSGFETGVAVMPLVHGDGETDEERLHEPHPELTEAARAGRRDHEHHARRQQPRHDHSWCRRRRSHPAARRTAAPSPTSRIAISATSSARSTTSRRSPSSGSPARPRWPVC